MSFEGDLVQKERQINSLVDFFTGLGEEETFNKVLKFNEDPRLFYRFVKKYGLVNRYDDIVLDSLYELGRISDQSVIGRYKK